MDIPKTPRISKELLDWLSVLFPDKAPDPEASERAVWMAAGAVAVVRKLKHEHQSQLSNSLEGIKIVG